MKRVVAVFIAILLLIGILIVNAAEKSILKIPDPQEYQITVSDGLILHAWAYPSPERKAAPLMVLLPMMAHTHDSYDPLIEALYRRAHSDSAYSVPLIMSIDLRGHGLSTSAGKSTLDYSSMSADEFGKMPGDIKEAIAYILADTAQNADGENIAVVGASIGANSAIMVSQIMPGLRKVVMLSPGENYRGLAPAESVKSFEGQMLIYVGAEDSYAAESSRKLSQLNSSHCRLVAYEGQDHGTDIINNNEKAMKSLLDWLAE